MPARTAPLPETDAVTLTDGGLETTLVFLDGLDLPDFASFPLLDDDGARPYVDRYFLPYLDLAERRGTGFVLDTATWRANPDWGLRLGYDAEALAEANRRAVDHAHRLAETHPGVPTVVNGVVGPRGDGYVVGETMSADQAGSYHALQALAFASAGAQMMTAVTMTYPDEAVGVVEAAAASTFPSSSPSRSRPTDDCRPGWTSVRPSVTSTSAPVLRAAYFMVNCAHPTHFATLLDPDEPWVSRVQGIRANSSTMSHAELDVAEDLDRGDVAGLAGHYGDLQRRLPQLRVVGGCCGTDIEHVTAIAEALA